MTVRKRDVIEISQIRKSGMWVSRFYEKGSEEALLSIPPAPTRQRALEVATKANRLLFCGQFRLPKPIKEKTDFVDELIEERTQENSDFPELVEAAYQKRSRRIHEA